MKDARDNTFCFTCPECFVSLKAKVTQAGARLACPSCSASIVVPIAPEAKSVAGTTDRTIDASAVEPGNEYGIRTSNGPVDQTSDLINVVCPICRTRAYTYRKNLGKTLRCAECGTAVPIVEQPKSQEQTRRPQKIDENAVGQYGVSSPDLAAASGEQVTIPFHCRLCDTLMRGSLAEVGTQLVCPDCGTKTIVPPPKKIDAKAVVGAAAGADLGEYGLSAPNVAVTEEIPVHCSLCGSRLMARADQIGKKIQCPDCGTATAVSTPSHSRTGAVMGAIAETETKPDDTSSPDPSPHTEKVVYIGVDCPRCGTRIQATDRQVGQKVPCPDCNTAITIPPPKADAAVQVQIITGSDEYGVSGPQEVLSRVPIVARALPKPPDEESESKPEEDPDFDFLKKDNSVAGWFSRDRSDKFGFLGHPDAFSRWLGYSLGGIAAFIVPGIAMMLFGVPTLAGSHAVAMFVTCGVFGVSGIALMFWAIPFAVSLVAIVQGTLPDSPIVEDWPEGNWLDQMEDSLYVFNSCVVCLLPASLLAQFVPSVRLWALPLCAASLWLAHPLVIFSMLEAGSSFSPLSRKVVACFFQYPLAWGWFYLRSLFLAGLGGVAYFVAWEYVCGPLALPLLAPLATTLMMIYARWLGILGLRVRETIEASRMVQEDEDE